MPASAQPTEYLEAHGAEYDAIHASPPCQAFSAMTRRHGTGVVASHPDLIAPVRALLAATGRPYVIENVPRAPLLDPVTLCGSMFGLASGPYQLRRHRRFEISGFALWPPAACAHVGRALGVYGHPGGSSVRDGLTFASFADWQIGMGVDWMTVEELAEAIPPAYTRHVGAALMHERVGR